VVIRGAEGEELKANFEVKAFMRRDQVLDSDKRLVRSVREQFGLKDRITRITMQFVDGAQHELHDAGWNVRLRRFEADDDLELTYKRRYPFGDGTLEAVRAMAACDGFDAHEDDYDAQVEWGSQRRTLTLSTRKKIHQRGSENMNLPNAHDSRTISADGLPGKLKRLALSGSAVRILSDAHVYGPVSGRRWTGEWSGTGLSIELWTLDRAPPEHRHVVEISFKHDDETEAGVRRKILHEVLSEKNWLLDEDVLKTELILKCY